MMSMVTHPKAANFVSVVPVQYPGQGLDRIKLINKEPPFAHC